MASHVDGLDLRPRDKNILAMMIGFFIILTIILHKTGYLERQSQDKLLNTHFSGVVDSTYYDTPNHHAATLRLTGGKHLTNYFEKKIQDIVLGDSLIKNKGSKNLYVYRNGRLVYTFDMSK